MENALVIEQEQEKPAARPRLAWDRAWFVVTSVVAILARLATWFLGVWVGLQALPVIRDTWTGSIESTIGICVGLIGLFAITEFIAWGWREFFEWMLAALEVRFGPRIEEIDDEAAA